MGLFNRRQPAPRAHTVGGVDLPILSETVSCNRCSQRGCRVLAVASSRDGGLLLTSKCFGCGKYRVLTEEEHGALYSSARAAYGAAPLPDNDKVTEYVFGIDSW